MPECLGLALSMMVASLGHICHVCISGLGTKTLSVSWMLDDKGHCFFHHLTLQEVCGIIPKDVYSDGCVTEECSEQKDTSKCEIIFSWDPSVMIMQGKSVFVTLEQKKQYCELLLL